MALRRLGRAPPLAWPDMTADQPYEPVAVDLRHFASFELDGPAARRVLRTDVVALDVVCLEPQQVLEARTFEDADAVYVVLGGRAWVVTDEAEVTLDPLQAVLVPAGVPHGVRNSSPDPLILQLVTSPPDEVPVLAIGPDEESVAMVRAEAERPGVLGRLRRALGS